jgi:hypothetical protein
MKKLYLPKILSIIFLISSNFNLNAQCVSGPPNVSINCGSSTTLAATTSAVTYNYVSTACSPLSNVGTDAFATTCDDCVTGQINIGFPFNFFGNTYTTAVVQSNGILGFGPTFNFTGFSSFAIPAAGTPNNYIAGVFADIDIRFGGTIKYQTIGTAPNRQFVVSYNNVVPYNAGTGAGTGTASFQIVLNETGSFQIIIKQFSANWNASSSGALATSGAENISGTFAFAIPGRNSTDWPGITAGSNDCSTFNPLPCVFQNWKDGATIVSTNPNYSANPSSTKTYTATWLCGGTTTCTANTIVTVNPTLGTPVITNNSNCANPNGSLNLSVSGLNPGSYTLNYDLNGTPSSQTVTIGTTTIVSQGVAFNSGNLSATDLKWNRNTLGTFCGATAGVNEYYDVISFVPNTTGNYNFAMCTPGTDWDGHASLYQNAFNGLNPCGTPSNFLIADDDGNSGGNCDNDALITFNLTSGSTYYLVTTSFTSGVLGNYEWSFTGPATATISYSNNSISLLSITSGVFTNLSLSTGGCGNINVPGSYTVNDSSPKTWSGTTSTDWNLASNWSGSVVPNASDCVYVPNTTNKPVISGTNYTAFAGTLTVLNGGILNLNTTNSIIVSDKVTVNTGGIFIIENNASLIQINNVANTGNIIYNRVAPNIKGSDYVYWSSPVASQNINNIYTSPIQGQKYLWNTIGANANGGLGNWNDATNATMINGQGYIVRGSSNYGMAATNIATTFNGVPNNGNITIKAKRGDMTASTVPSFYTNSALSITDDNWSLLGNPYPSAINGLQFLQTNSSNLIGTLYLWRHLNNPALIASPFYQNFTYNYNSSDYLSVNYTGTTTPGASDIIKSGQAFMVQRIEGAQDLIGVDVVFNNAMRLNVGVPYANNNFYRNAIQIDSQNNNQNFINLERHRIWLDIIDNTTMLSETTLLGYVQGATQNIDNLFDGPLAISNTTQIYSIQDNQNLIIQGRALPFEVYDEVQLGVNVVSNGNYKIALNTVDGLFESQNIYLQDKLLNITNDMKMAPYNFTSEIGIFNDRFTMKYSNTSLAINQFETSNDFRIATGQKLTLFSVNQNIKKVEIFDLLGRKIDEYKNLNTKNLVLENLLKSNKIYIVKTTFENDSVIAKKVIF